MAKNTNPFNRNQVIRNPYHRNAFRVTRVPREITRRRTVSLLISQTRNVIRTDAKAHTIHGEPVDAAELNWAESIMMDAKSRIIEELIQHSAEKPNLEHLRTLSAELLESLKPEEAALDTLKLNALIGWVPELISQCLDEISRTSPLYGPYELEIVPPVPLPEKENRNDE